jgi:hypothetical protein
MQHAAKVHFVRRLQETNNGRDGAKRPTLNQYNFHVINLPRQYVSAAALLELRLELLLPSSITRQSYVAESSA